VKISFAMSVMSARSATPIASYYTVVAPVVAQTACIVHHRYLFDMTYRKNITTITFLKFCVTQLNSQVIYNCCWI